MYNPQNTWATAAEVAQQTRDASTDELDACMYSSESVLSLQTYSPTPLSTKSSKFTWICLNQPPATSSRLPRRRPSLSTASPRRCVRTSTFESFRKKRFRISRKGPQASTGDGRRPLALRDRPRLERAKRCRRRCRRRRRGEKSRRWLRGRNHNAVWIGLWPSPAQRQQQQQQQRLAVW